jgi:electron-transferring-flavoprotein dehydrogenase
VPTERERLDADVLIVGAGPAGLACALHLSNLIHEHNESGAQPQLSTENIYVLEKAREIGGHQLSGAIMDPIALRELVPDFAKATPFDTPVTSDAFYFFTSKSAWKSPITPPPFHNHGNYIVSLNKLVKWLGGLAEKTGVNLFTQFAGASLIYENGGIGGVITEDKGVDKNGKPKDNYTPGYELRAKVTVLAEGPRGSLTKQLVNEYELDGINPQTYGIGIKELWEVPAGQVEPGFVAHTLGWPLPFDIYGGGWIYGLKENRVSIGMVTALEYKNPLFDPHEAFQRYKIHPFAQKILSGGKMIRYGAKTVPYGGWYSRPKSAIAGALIIGDSGSLLNSQRLKGIHTAIKSGMLAAETIFESLRDGDTSAAKLAGYEKKLGASWIKKELWAVRNFHQGYEHGLLRGMFHTGVQMITGGRGLIDPMHTKAGYQEYRTLNRGNELVDQSTRFKGDGKLTFDRLTDVYHSGTRHEEDQPCHLVVTEPDLCGNRCVREYGNPCQYFCPAAVYEMTRERDASKLKINASNCVHCKTCDIADPYQIINWITPEGGGGPNYEGM